MDIDEVNYKHQRFMGLLGNKIIDNVGGFDGKKPPNKKGNYKTVSLGSHIIDATLLGINSYIYDSIVRNGDTIDNELLDILTTALVLHDVNKVVTHKTENNITYTTEETLETYFEEDWFGIESFLDEHAENPVDEYFDILFYLIKRTEKRDSIEDLPDISIRYKRLSRYCELGDSLASVMVNNAVIQDGYSHLTDSYYVKGNHAQDITLYQGSRPIIHSLLVESIEELINEEYGLMLGSTPEGMLYLGDELDVSNITSEVAERIKEKIATQFSFSCKANWQTVNYNELPMIDIPLESKKEIIRENYISCIKDEKAGTEKFESIPDEFLTALPVILHRVYYEKNFDFDNDELQQLYDRLSDELFGSKVKIHLINEVLQDYDRYGEIFINECMEFEDDFIDSITVDSNSIQKIVERTLGLEIEDSVIPSSDSSCYMCGCEADNQYSGDVIYNANAFSKRTAYNQRFKLICDFCMMEHALVKSLIEDSDSYSDNVMMVYFWYDSFSVSIGYEEVADTSSTQVLDSDIAFDDESDGLGALSLKQQLVHFQPISMDGGRVESNKNKKLRLVKNILERIKNTGLKARLATPFNDLDFGKEVFVDNAPIKEQEALNITKLEYFEDLERPIELLNLGNMLHGATSENYPYQYIIPDTPENLIHNAERKFDRDVSSINLYQSYTQDYHEDIMTTMNNVAKKGIELYGYQYDSKYAKTKVFRESLDALIDAISRDVDDESKIELVAGQAMRSAETQSEYVTSEQAEAFATSLLDYVEETQYNSLNEIANKKNVIADTYKFAYENQLNKSD